MLLKCYEIVLKSGVKITATPGIRNEDFPVFVAEVKSGKEPHALVGSDMYVDIHEIAFVFFVKRVECDANGRHQ